MEQEVRRILEIHASDRLAAIEMIERSWDSLARTPESAEVDSWIAIGRP